MAFQSDNHIYDVLVKFERDVRKALSARLDPYGVRPGQIPVLLALYPDKRLNQKQLVEKIAVEQPTLANTLRRMERDALISAQRQEQDRRTVLYALTASGQQAHDVAYAAKEDVRLLCEQGLTITDLRYFRKILSQMSHHVANDLNDPALFLADVVDNPGE